MTALLTIVEKYGDIIVQEPAEDSLQKFGKILER